MKEARAREQYRRPFACHRDRVPLRKFIVARPEGDGKTLRGRAGVQKCHYLGWTGVCEDCKKKCSYSSLKAGSRRLMAACFVVSEPFAIRTCSRIARRSCRANFLRSASAS